MLEDNKNDGNNNSEIVKQMESPVENLDHNIEEIESYVEITNLYTPNTSQLETIITNNNGNDNDGDDSGNDHNKNDNVICTLKSFMHNFRLNETKEIYKFKPLHIFNCKLSNYPGEYPKARTSHRILGNESNLYYLCGLNFDRTSEYCQWFPELWSYNFATNLWSLLLDTESAIMPREMAANSLILYGNALLQYGGIPFGELFSNECYVYTTDQNPRVIRLQTTGCVPAGMYGSAIVIHNGYLYVIGGTTGIKCTCDVFRLNLRSRLWEKLYTSNPDIENNPGGRYKHGIVYYDNYIYVFGGSDDIVVYDFQRIPTFNVITNQWAYIDTIPDHTASTVYNAGYPISRKRFSCVEYKTSNDHMEVLIVGGYCYSFLDCLDDIWKLNLQTKRWSKIHYISLPRPIYFHSAAHAHNGCLYIMNHRAYDKFHPIDLYKMWLTIPKLSEICWEAITFYNNNLQCYKRSTLLSLGIPKHFVNRLPLNNLN